MPYQENKKECVFSSSLKPYPIHMGYNNTEYIFESKDVECWTNNGSKTEKRLSNWRKIKNP